MSARFEACPVCGRSGPTKRGRAGPSTVVRCEGCGLHWCDPLPAVSSASAGASSVLTEEAYTQGLLTHPEGRAARFDALARARHERYARDLGRASFRVLEIGCGAAGLAPEFTRLGVSYSGLDLDPRPVEAARQRGIQGLRVGDFLELPDEEPYDVICLSQVLEHITRPTALVAKMARWLVPGGLVHVDVPNHRTLAGWPSRLRGGTRGRFGAIEWPHHALSYGLPALDALFAPTFDVRVFTAAPDDPTWGQAVVASPGTRAYYLLSRAVGAASLAVAYGSKRKD